MEFSADDLLEHAYTDLVKQNSGILPVNKYLSEALNSYPECMESAIRIKNHLIKTLQERLKYGLIVCNKKIANIINDLAVDNIDVKLLFLFSDSADYREKKKNVLSRGYSYIFEKSKSDDISVEYAYINKIELGCLKKAILRAFEKEGIFELV